MRINLLLVDDHAVVRSGLRMLLEGEKDVEIVGEAGSASEAIKVVSSLRPDVVLWILVYQICLESMPPEKLKSYGQKSQ